MPVAASPPDIRPLVCHPFDMAHDPQVIFAAGAITAVILICLLLLAVDAMAPRKRKPRGKL